MERIPGLLASAYNKAAAMATDSYYVPVAAEIVSTLKTGMVLDLGTGPGYLPVEIVKRSPTISVVGIDLTPELIKLARENSVKSGVADRLHFEIMDAANLLFEDSSYDMVFSSGMLHSMRTLGRVSRVIKECHRVLRPGGELWIFDPAKICSGIDRRVWEASLTLAEKVLYGLFRLSELLNPPRYHAPAEIARIVVPAGFDAYHVGQHNGEMRVKARKL